MMFAPDLYYGGVAEVVYKTATFLSAHKRFDVSVVVYENTPVNFSLPPAVKVHKIGVPLIARFGKSRAAILKRAILRYVLLPLGLVRFITLKQRLGPEVIIVHSPVLSFISLLSKKREKVIVVDHGLPYKDLQHKLIIKHIIITISKILYHKADGAVAISKPLMNYYLKDIGLDENKVAYIPNFIDLKKIAELSAEALELKFDRIYSCPVVVNVGRLTQQKGQWHLLRAFKKVKENVEEARLVIVGDGELRDGLTRLAKELGIKDCVYFLGWQDNPFKYIVSAQVFVFPSLWEGFPFALVEAMACGVPVIASDCKSGPREVLAPDTDPEYETKKIEYAKYGILTPVPDGVWRPAQDPLTREEELLAEAIVKLLEDKTMRMKYSEASKDRATDYSTNRIIPRWIEFVESVMG